MLRILVDPSASMWMSVPSLTNSCASLSSMVFELHNFRTEVDDNLYHRLDCVDWLYQHWRYMDNLILLSLEISFSSRALIYGYFGIGNQLIVHSCNINVKLYGFIKIFDWCDWKRYISSHMCQLVEFIWNCNTKWQCLLTRTFSSAFLFLVERKARISGGNIQINNTSTWRWAKLVSE